jgi:hypothetical protein
MAAWTFSQLEKYTTCPKQFYHLRVAKDFKDPPTEHTMWGEAVHTAFEYRIAEGTPLPEGMSQWEGIAAKLAALKGKKYVEHQIGISKSFAPSPWAQSWSRGILDLLVVDGSKAGVFDYKTGKRKQTDQLSLYAAYTFAAFPQVETVTTGFIWLKDKKIDTEKFTRDDVPTIWQSFLPTVRKLELAYDNNQWPARPSGLCRAWCAVTSCPHNGKK